MLSRGVRFHGVREPGVRTPVSIEGRRGRVLGGRERMEPCAGPTGVWNAGGGMFWAGVRAAAGTGPGVDGAGVGRGPCGPFLFSKAGVGGGKGD